MGLLNNILENDSDNINHILVKDEVLIEAEKKFYELLEDKGLDFTFAMEDVFNTFTVRVMRIAYLQGLKDFNYLFIELRPDASVILDDYEKSV